MSDRPVTMHVARLYHWGDVRLEEVAIPVPGPGELLVRIEACGVCGSDALTWYVEQKAPTVLGHEPAAIVEDVGAGVTQFKPGERVFVHHHAPCLECAECRRGLWSNCATWRATSLDPGGFAQYARVPAVNVARDVLPIPAPMDLDTATFIEPLACCIRAVRRQGHTAPDDAVLVVGLGAMGLLMVQLARAYGASVVVGTDFLAERRERAVAAGADVALDPADDPVGELHARTAGRGADVVLVTPGDARAVIAGLAGAAPGARVVCFTPLPPDQPVSLPLGDLYFREVTLLQSYSCGPDETRAALQLLDEGRVEVASLVTHRAGLEGVAAALERARGKGDGIKTIVYPFR